MSNAANTMVKLMLEVVLVVTVLLKLLRYHYKVLTFMELDKTTLLVVDQVEEEPYGVSDR